MFNMEDKSILNDPKFKLADLNADLSIVNKKLEGHKIRKVSKVYKEEHENRFFFAIKWFFKKLFFKK